MSVPWRMPHVTADDVLEVWLTWKSHLPVAGTADAHCWTHDHGMHFVQNIRALFDQADAKDLDDSEA